MDPETKALLEKNLALSQENNKLLRGLRNSARLSNFLRVLYIAFFLGGGLIAYQYLEPYFIQAKDSYNSFTEAQQQAKDAINRFTMPR